MIRAGGGRGEIEVGQLVVEEEAVAGHGALPPKKLIVLVKAAISTYLSSVTMLFV